MHITRRAAEVCAVPGAMRQAPLSLAALRFVQDLRALARRAGGEGRWPQVRAVRSTQSTQSAGCRVSGTRRLSLYGTLTTD